VFERLRTILHEAQIDKRVQYMIEVMFAVRKDGFKVKKNLFPSHFKFLCLCFWRTLCKRFCYVSGWLSSFKLFALPALGKRNTVHNAVISNSL